MRLYVGITDHDWFHHVRSRRPLDVNFWRPGGTTRFGVLEPGGLFLFKLKKRHGGLVVGGGYFSRFDALEPSTAWDVFGEDNGTPTRAEFLARLGKLGGKRNENREIGCILLSEPFILPEPFEIPIWSNSIVSGKSYDTTEPEGAAIYDEVRRQLETVGDFIAAPARIATPTREYDAPAQGELRPVRARIGQGEFRLRTLENYRYTCCVTGEHTRPALEAAHILPVAESGRHRLDNGLCLRADVHRLFDRGLIGITPEYCVAISPQIRELYLNGKPYYAHENAELRALPDHVADRPDRDALARHMADVFRRA
ncbi:HNH endonuclease [bacterium]|nr:MAG: HNH endonuclease [bacterium]